MRLLRLIALVCRPSPVSNRQWSMASLCDELRCFQYHENHNFRFDQLALHQGLTIFKKTIEQSGCTIVRVGSEGFNNIKEFMDLPAKSRGANIIFKTGTLTDQTTLDFLVSEIHGTVSALLSRTFKFETQYVSISPIYGVLWLRQIDVVCEASETSKKRIKRGEDIGYRQMQRYGKQVYEYVADTICAVNESPTKYINAAVEESSLRSTTELKSVRRNIFNNDEATSWSFCDPHTRTGCTGTGVRSVRIEDDPIHTIHCLIPAVYICKLTTLLSPAPASSHIFLRPRSSSPPSQRPES